jgi:hypothetical protein
LFRAWGVFFSLIFYSKLFSWIAALSGHKGTVAWVGFWSYQESIPFLFGNLVRTPGTYLEVIWIRPVGRKGAILRI